jgi:hypothetical protein
MVAAAHAGAGDVVSKGEFARLCNVTPGRVSQWLSEGKIKPTALVGEGRSARIIVEVARAQLRGAMDIGQRFGNGIGTQLPGGESGSHEAAPARPALVDPFEEQMRAEKLREIQFRNRDAAEKELARRGTYVRADHTRAALTTVAAAMLNVFEGSLADLAHAVAAKFEVPQRDVVHLLRTEFRAIRTRAAEQARKSAETMPSLVSDEVADA